MKNKRNGNAVVETGGVGPGAVWWREGDWWGESDALDRFIVFTLTLDCNLLMYSVSIHTSAQVH